MDLIVCVGATALFFFLRLYPIWPKRFQGCDAYNIMLCAEMLRMQKSLPIRLPDVFILEDRDQWYPPGFLILCALIPEKWLSERYWLLNHIVDLVHASIIFVFSALSGQIWLGAAAVLLYATLPALLTEYANLNTRPLGVLLLSAFLLTAHQGMSQPIYIPLSALIGIALLYSHKLSSQQLWFTLPFLALFTGHWAWLVWLPAIYLLAYIAWPFGFRNILAGHRNIIRFWHRYWPLLGAHMVRQSPVYGDNTTRTDYYAVDGWPGFIRFIKNTIHQNYFVIPLFIVAVIYLPDDPLERFLLGWVASVYLWALLIHVLPNLRGIGLAGQYIKFAHMPIFLCLTMNFSSFPLWIWLVSLTAVVLSIRQYIMVGGQTRSELKAQSGRISPELDALLRRIRSLKPAPRVICLPVHLCDLVAYKTRVPTYWGTHSHCFDEKLAEFFPVFRREIKDYVQGDGLTHLLLDLEYTTAEELGLNKKNIIERKGNYSLYRLDDV